MKKREKYENFLKKVELFKEMDAYEKQKVCDAIKARYYNEGDYIIRQGEQGDCLYFIVEGDVVATKSMKAGT